MSRRRFDDNYSFTFFPSIAFPFPPYQYQIAVPIDNLPVPVPASAPPTKPLAPTALFLHFPSLPVLIPVLVSGLEALEPLFATSTSAGQDTIFLVRSLSLDDSYHNLDPADTMMARGATTAAALLLASLSLWASPLHPVLVVAKDEPAFHVQEFDHYPQNLNYFDQSDVILFQDVNNQNVWRSPDGGQTWNRVEEVPDGKAFALVLHEFDNNRAYILSESTSHWRTEDRGKTWKTFFTDSEFNIFRSEVFNFHATDHDRIIFNGMDCKGIFCDEVAMYTLDGFSTDAKFLRGNTEGCWWAKGSDLFTTGQSELDKQRIMCIVRDAFSPLKQDNRLLISDNYFSAKSADGVVQEFEPNLDTNRPVQGIVNVASVKKYIMVATASLNTDEMALFVSDDTLKWHRAMFPTDHRLDQEAYTVLESTNYSIQIDVMTTRPSNPMGVMLTSNSNGTFFTRNIEHTNRNMMGHVDFEKIAGIQGIFIVNKVSNWKEVESEFLADKKVVSEITHDDGRTFVDVHNNDGERIHLHSVTQLINVGRVFSSPAPGLVMANGNPGDYLRPYSEAYLYISDDAGMHWWQGPKGPHKYEFGDQGGVLVAIHDSDKADVGEIKYSLDHGKTWRSQALPGGLKIRPWVLTTTPDSTSLKFILTGQIGDEMNSKFKIIAIDFDGLHERTCAQGDMEDWWARVDDDSGKPTCLMGHTQRFTRRKKTADCFMKQEHHLVQVQTNDCDCTDADFECDYNFRREEGKCVPAGPIIAPDGACVNAKPDETFMGSSGWRIIPGNTCKRTGTKQKDDPVERKCADSHSPPKAPASGKVDSTQHVFKGSRKPEVHYLERGDTSSTGEETIIARSGGDILLTRDGGKTWETPKALEDSFWGIVPHTYFKDMVLFIKTDGKVVYTINYGQSFDEFQAPVPPKTDLEQSPFAFHPDKKDWIIWVGEKCTTNGATCYQEAMLSKDRGDNWQTLKRYVDRCEFTGSAAYKYRAEDQIICKARTREDVSQTDNPWQLVAGPADDFDDKSEVVQSDVKDFATMSEFIVVATQNTTKNTLRALASLDGVTYAEAHFPHNFEVPLQHAYTVLDSSTHAVNLFVATSDDSKRLLGAIMKSNSNGTSYVTSISNVNCNEGYYVDFEKMLGLEGVALVNVVANPDKTSEPKKLRSLISHNDGAEWAYMPPPTKDLDGKSTGCSGKGDSKCALHIHGYTERRDHSKTYSSAGAVGLMFAWGNVGEYLGTRDEADTYMTTDAGISWKQVKKGRWLWQFGDQGSIIVLVPSEQKTNTVSYSTDEGETWNEYKFGDKELTVADFTTQRSGVSRKFIVWQDNGGSEWVATTLDFSGLADHPCEQKDDLGESDYRIWSPSHPLLDDDCLFGHVTQYMRKKTDRQCYNGYRIQHIYNSKNCTCTRRDYECDYNFELDAHGACHLVPGLQPVDPVQYCKENSNAVEYWDPTGYRKVPLSTCQDGQEYDKQSEVHPCPNKEDEFNERHGISGVGLFFAITIPFAVAGAAGWWVYRNWNGKFGQIRLGDHGSPGFGNGAFDSDSPFVRYPIIAVSAIVAVAGAIPLLVAGLWRTGVAAVDRLRHGGGGSFSRLSGGARPFTTRDSFARGRGDYATVDDDEGELLGEDSDEEV